MTARLAVQLAPHELPELQAATRTLLRSPLVTARRSDELRLVLKWETVLRNELAQKFGYRLDVSRNAARLLRRPTSLSSQRAARLEGGRALGRWGYVYLCLTLAALEQPGHQVIASELLARITNLARGDDRLGIDTTEYAQRRAFRDSVRYLEQLGVLTVRDGDVESLLHEGQVLWDLDRDAAAMCMVAAPSILRSVRSVHDFIAEPEVSTPEGRSRIARQRLNRRLVDQPVVLLGDLSTEEAELAWRNRRREAENVARLTGCEVELRREGIVVVDHPSQPIGGQRFPGSDSVAHAALLWLTALLDHLGDRTSTRASSSHEVEAQPDQMQEGGDDGLRRVPAAIAERCWQDVLKEYSARLSRDARERPDAFRADVEALLVRFRLAEFVPDAVLVTPPASRYRAAPALVGPVRVGASDEGQQVMF
jgi:uncharacterized protein (TIGR02678 family)